MPIAPGSRLGPYEVLSALGAGGMGEVYRARDTRLERDVAVKVLSDALLTAPGALERFQREARAASALSHPNICTIFDVGSDPPFLAMELLEGETLQQRLARGALEPSEAIDCALAVADALNTAHAKGIVQRDIKPANIFVTARRRTARTWRSCGQRPLTTSCCSKDCDEEHWSSGGLRVGDPVADRRRPPAWY